MGVESVPAPEALPHAYTLEVSYYFFIRVLLSALEFMEGMRHTSNRS